MNPANKFDINQLIFNFFFCVLPFHFANLLQQHDLKLNHLTLLVEKKNMVINPKKVNGIHC